LQRFTDCPRRLWLRVFAILASFIGLPYFHLQTTVLWEPIAWCAVPLTEGVDAKVAGSHFGRFPAGAIIAASALFDPGLPQIEAIAGESCRVLWLPITAMKERAKRDSQLARTIDRVAREDLARKLARLAHNLQPGWDERRTGA
jgi:hypothetical protein